MRNFFPLASLLALLVAFGCNTPREAIVMAPPMEQRDLDTMTVTPAANGVIDDRVEAVVKIPNERPVYNAAQPRVHDLLHTKLELRFDWEKEMVIGVATLRLTPMFRPSKQVTLDAKNFTINSLKDGNGRDLNYEYTGDKQTITVMLPREYRRGEEYTLVFDYTAVPAQSGGSAAITSDKGLFFINPRGEEGPDKPRQIWTQGETENNSRWFPTMDQPNERCTQEMYITVADKYETLSNGTLVSSTPAGGGMRTDYWKMDQPHAPYLFMLTVGDFDIVEDQVWNGKPVNYYMEKGWKDHAKAIYPYTREMLTFFSDLTGVQYPWPKYSQVAVRDYVSGAMENTSAVIFGEFMHGTERSLIDVEINEKIVAHEMFHHWFGDLVTCESWANLTLNEGFANYSEYLWMEEKHGRDAADNHMLEERGGYFGSAQRQGVHELIWYDYPDKEAMFDAHSYNKGGSVLHMLRDYLGDDAFFASLKKYLTDNEFSAVEVDELRMAFEDVTGEDLQWFFDQWFLSAGHPNLKLTTEYADGMARLTVEQTQATDENVPAVFRLPTQVAVFTNGSGTPAMYDIIVDQRKQTFEFPATAKPDVVIFDPQHTLLATFDYEKSPEELLFQFKNAVTFIDRNLTVQRMSRKEDGPLKDELFTAALRDPFHSIRMNAMRAINNPTVEQLRLIEGIAKSDAHSGTRAAAIEMLAEQASVDQNTVKMVAREALQARPYPVVAAGLTVLADIDPQLAAATAKDLEEVDNGDIAGAIASLYSEVGDVSKLSYFENRMDKVSGYGAIDLMRAYQSLLAKADDDKIKSGVALMKARALNQGNDPFKRAAATIALNDLREGYKNVADGAAMVEQLGKVIGEIKAAETEPQLQGLYQQFGN